RIPLVLLSSCRSEGQPMCQKIGSENLRNRRLFGRRHPPACELIPTGAEKFTLDETAPSETRRRSPVAARRPAHRSLVRPARRVLKSRLKAVTQPAAAQSRATLPQSSG